jgi:phosphomannomutase/phosphoglucomutase
MLREYFKKEKPCVVYDIKSSFIVAKEAEKLGGRAIMERSGHSLFRRTFLAHNSTIAGEISGHFFFRELGQDDGIYAALRLAKIVADSKISLSALTGTVNKTTITPDIRIPWPYEEQDALIGKMEKLGKIYGFSNMDGVRLDFGHGWALIRKSVTEQAVTLRIEAETTEQVKEIALILTNTEAKLNVPQIQNL